MKITSIETMPPQGTWLEDAKHDVYIVLEQSEFFHTEGMLVDIFSGKLVHFSEMLPPIKATNAQSIIW